MLAFERRHGQRAGLTGAAPWLARLVEAGSIVREHDPSDRRRVRLDLTQSAEHHLADLSSSHLQELHRMRPALVRLFDQADAVEGAGQR